jgi:hypothetical protein
VDVETTERERLFLKLTEEKKGEVERKRKRV